MIAPKEIWLTVYEVMRIEKIKERAFYYRFKKGYYSKYRYVESAEGGRGGKRLEIALSCLSDDAKREYFKEVYRKKEEPKVENKAESKPITENKNEEKSLVVKSDILPAITPAITPPTIPPITTTAPVITNLPAIKQDSLPPAPLQSRLIITQDQTDKAILKHTLLTKYQDYQLKSGRKNKTKAKKDFQIAYNTGSLYPEIYKALGKIHWSTLERWKRLIKESNRDPIRTLADMRGNNRKGLNKFSLEAFKILLGCALSPNKPPLTEAIRMAKKIMEIKGVPDNYSDSGYRKILNKWTETNWDLWIMRREGVHEWNEECALSIERDKTLIDVGTILVADGHKLNFEIINPETGKPKRMTLVLWYDMRSNFPLGWEIMLTENTQAIASALRRSILRLGKYPQIAYLDNGKAFGAKHFNGVDLEQKGFSGLFARLGIKTIFAWAYHPQSKPIERFFRNFAELERWMPTYVGTSIETKPPRMKMGEKLHRRVYEKIMDGKCITLEMAHRAIAYWFDEYANRPQDGHLLGYKPIEVFEEGKGPGVDPYELNFLMMSKKKRNIRQNGIRFLNTDYYDPQLYGRRHEVTIYYDLQDQESVLVQDPKTGEFICRAYKMTGTHPAASILGTDEDKKKLQDRIKLKKLQEKYTTKTARDFVEDQIIPDIKKNLARQGLITDDTGRVIKTEDKTPDLGPTDLERLEKEVARKQRENEKLEKERLFKQIDNLAGMKKYLKVLEAEIRGWSISKDLRSFMSFFEKTNEFRIKKQDVLLEKQRLIQKYRCRKQEGVQPAPMDT